MAQQKDMSFFRYDESHRFAQEYPRLARQIVDDYALEGGVCVDVGTGGGALAIELAKLTQMEFIGLDKDETALAMAAENVLRHGVDISRFRFVPCDVHSMPLPDDSADFVVSRGSIPFWDDRAQVLAEVLRILRPGGKTFVGCGFARNQPVENVNKLRPKWAREGSGDEKMSWRESPELENLLSRAGVRDYHIVDEKGYGKWIEIHKEIRS